MYTWDFEPQAREQFRAMPRAAQEALRDFMEAAVIADPMEFLRDKNEHTGALRTLSFGPHNEGLVTFLVYVRGELVLVVQVTWAGP